MIWPMLTNPFNLNDDYVCDGTSALRLTQGPKYSSGQFQDPSGRFKCCSARSKNEPQPCSFIPTTMHGIVILPCGKPGIQKGQKKTVYNKIKEE